jgi:ATP-dependent DNA helicase RecG
MSGRRVKITAVLSDPTGSVAAVWIRAGHLPPTFRVGTRLAVSGSFVRYGRQAYFDNPEYEPAADRPLNTRRTVPVYPLTAGISQPLMRAIIRQALERLPPVEESLPAELLLHEQLCARNEAVRKLHWPASAADIEAAQRRLAFDEMLPIQLFVLQRRNTHRAVRSPSLPIPWPLLAEFRRHLPFALTRAQQRVLSTILEDVASDEPMARLLQGEVGSGKTVVAAMVVLSAVASGGQAALMAPTEILAEQHFRTLEGLYGGTRATVESAVGHHLRMARLSGALSRSQRERRLKEIAAGEVDLVVGTHAVIQADVEFPNLVLTIVDEQHRFGVGQRLALRQKGKNPHLLVMTATPIPRTLALTLYGDLDVSTIDELPAGRKAITTTLLHGGNRSQAYAAVREEVAAGHQAFVICPLVEGSPATEARAAVTEYERLRTTELAGLRVALLHGRLRAAEKDRVMSQFAAGAHDVLISTSVVEVGIDVPNATVMAVEGAERFGLAQLHQFRGRVGRGPAPSRCFLIAGTESPESLERLSIVARSTDGLELAEEDLRIRGPGDYFGTRQSGFPALRIARLTDLDFVQHVREVARRLLDGDPHLERPEHRHLALGASRFAEDAGDAN